MSDFQFQDENSIRAVFSMEVGREMNDHSMLYNKSLPNQHPISAITGLTEALAEGSSNLQTEIDRAEAAEQALDDKIEAETTRAEGVESGLNTAISNETSARIQADTTLQNNITAEENRAKGIENGLRSDITAETTARQNADNNLQSQIDAISASSDVTDIVGTYAELQAYDTSTLTNDDIIKVLQDESQGGATTYYRWVVSGSSGAFVLIGSEGPYYTKAEADELLDEKQDEITDTNKLASDLVNDTNQTNKFVTASEKSQITTNANNIVDLQNSKASTSLDNLSADGQMIVDSQNGTISNCILEIPQNIKLELSNNVLTLKAGSTVVLTNRSVYTTTTTTQDYSTTFLSSAANGRYWATLSGSSLVATWLKINITGSGTSLPADNSQYSLFFLISDGIGRYYNWNANTNSWNFWNNDGSYPLCVIEVTNGVASFAKDSNGNDMIFNGAGFIGHHAFVYPNVTVFYPNGYSDVKHLNSVKITTNQLYITELSSVRNCLYVASYSSQVASIYRGADLNDKNLITSNNEYHYITTENYVYSKTSSGYVQRPLMFFVDFSYNGTAITDFTIRQPVRTATVEMLDKIQSQVDTNTTAIASKQDTLVSGTNIKTINSTTVLGSGNFALADQSLSNLDNDGQMIVDSQNGTISNCVLEIPQNIKCELSGTTYTLKAGSVRVKLGETYTTQTVVNDMPLTIDVSTDGRFVIIGSSNNEAQINIEKISSGTTTPLTKTTDYFWNITDKLMYRWVSADSMYKQFSTWYYPSCLIDVVSGVASFAKDSNGNDMIFNGAGFIGNHMFYYPNPRIGLRGNGFNSDGTLASELVGTNSLSIVEIGITIKSIAYAATNVIYRYRGYHVVEKFTDISNPQNYHLYYVKNENIIYEYVSNAFTVYKSLNLIDVAYNGTTVTNFTIRQPVRTATVEMLDKKQNDITSITGYDATKTQTLKNVNGTLTWVDD